MARKRKSCGNAFYCDQCRKLVWSTLGRANEEIERLKATGDVRKPHLLNAFRYPKGSGWHIGHDYKLLWTSLCIGEHK